MFEYPCGHGTSSVFLQQFDCFKEARNEKAVKACDKRASRYGYQTSQAKLVSLT